ncbi:MAG: hypothetical protein ACRC7S_16920 [Cetobacterium sp.]
MQNKKNCFRIFLNILMNDIKESNTLFEELKNNYKDLDKECRNIIIQRLKLRLDMSSDISTRTRSFVISQEEFKSEVLYEVLLEKLESEIITLKKQFQDFSF